MDHDRLPPVSLFRLFWKMGGWLVLIFGVTLLLLTLIGHLSFRTAERFAGEGLPAMARVTDKYTTTSRDSDGDKVTTYWLSVEFVTQRGRTMALDDTVSF